MEKVELYEQVVLDKPRVDRDAGIIYKAKVMGLNSCNGYSYSLSAIKETASKYEGMPVGIDHSFNSNPLQVAKVWATLSNPVVDDTGVWADLNYLKSHPLTEQILEDCERNTALFSLSSVNSGCIQRGKVVEKFTPIRCDIVCKGATTKTLLEQDKMEEIDVKKEEEKELVEITQSGVTYEQFNQQVEQINKLCESISNLEKRFDLIDKYVAPKTNLEQKIDKVTKNIDLKQFWNDK